MAEVDQLGLTLNDGDEVVVGGNTPFLLDVADMVWVVRSGRVEVFAVNVEDGQARGTRHHYLTADPGDVLFGIDLARFGEGLGLLGVGLVGTRLQRVSLARIRAAAKDPAYAGEVASAVERWVTGLSRGVSRTSRR